MGKAWRAWDYEDRAWHFAWMSEKGEMQIWDCFMENEIFYLSRKFSDEEQTFISRHGFQFDNDRTLIRTAERSLDDGKTWTLRNSKKYKKVSRH